MAGPSAYYRCGDKVGSFSVADSSGNNYTASLVGAGTFGTLGAFLSDSNTCLDCTAGTNAPQGGFAMVDTTTQPPTYHNPLGATTTWAFECWFKWTGPVGGAITNAYDTTTSTNISDCATMMQAGSVFAVLIGSVYNSTTGTSAANTISIFDNTGNGIYYFAPGNLFDQNWHHLIVNENNSINPSVFLDGAQVGSPVTIQGAPSTNNPAYISFGVTGNGFSSITAQQSTVYAFSGSLQEVALYTGTLTAAQALAHYQHGQWFRSVETAYGVGPTPRLKTVIDVVGLPDSILYSPYNWVTALYGESQPVTTTSGLNYIQTISETEPGLIFQGPDGRIWALNREYQYLASNATSSQVTFGDAASVSLHYDGPSLQIVSDDLDLWNTTAVQSGRQGFQLAAVNNTPGAAQSFGAAPFNIGGGQLEVWGPAQSTSAAQSASVYGARTLQGLTSLQEQYDSDALAMAQWYEFIYNSPIPRVQQMRIDSWAASGAGIVQQLSRGIYDRVTVFYNGQSGGTPFQQDGLIEATTHQIDMENGPTFSTTWALSPYEILLTPTILGTWKFGDSGTLTL